MKPKRKRDFTGMFIMAVLLSFILPLGYLVVRIVSHGGGTEEVRSREDYVLMLLQCLLGIAAIVLPLAAHSAENAADSARDAGFVHCVFVLRDLPRRGAKLLLRRTALGHNSAHDERRNAGCAWLFHDCDFQ